MIGIDFDNTIVRYDHVFRAIAVEQGLVTPEHATSKTAIRDHLRRLGLEDRWTELQGTIYGPRMMDAVPYPGAIEFFRACRRAGLDVAIVSHRTRFPYRGARHDLHAAARDWLRRHGFHDPALVALPENRVFFEESKEAKLRRIEELGCTHFIDDLPDILAHREFPRGVHAILFDPHGHHQPMAGIASAASWPQLARLLIDGHHDQPTASDGTGQPMSAACERLLTSAGLSPPFAMTRLSGGGNNRVSRIDTAAGPVVLKEYFRHAGDPRDRLGAEQAFTHLAWEHGVRSLPRPIACDREAGMAVSEFIPGRRLVAGDVTAQHVDEAAAFFTAVNRIRTPAVASLPTASEACFSLAEHLDCIDRRMARLEAIGPETALHLEAAACVAGRLRPAWKRIRTAAVAAGAAGGRSPGTPIVDADRVISPSDFGFHNCLATDSGVRFIDFEYAGWDDPAKTVCDFFCQPAVPVPRPHFERFFAAVAGVVEDGSDLRRRVDLLLPVYELKWCCIMLNEFLPVGDRRRAFAGADDEGDTRRHGQLQKVDAALARLGY